MQKKRESEGRREEKKQGKEREVRGIEVRLG